jgi:3-hydroxyisobutyrate dehydrogenase-like beta-hydroxyacid dehydrogenase
VSATSAIGLCGLGNMGLAIAGRLAAAGPVVGYDLDRDRVDTARTAHGVVAADGLTDLGGLDLVLLSLPTPAASLAVAGALAETLPRGAVVVETSTVNPSDLQRCARLLEPRGIALVDAAVLSGVAQTEAGTATLLLGGADEDLDRAEPALTPWSRTRTRLGPLGAGMATKVINNAVAHAVMVVLAEAGALAAGAGVRRDRLAELLARPDAGLIRPLTHRFAERVLHDGFEGGMPTEAARKDSVLALALAQETGVPLFAVQAAHAVYEVAVAEDLGRLDYAAVATLWERWTGRPLADEDEGSGS